MNLVGNCFASGFEKEDTRGSSLAYIQVGVNTSKHLCSARIPKIPKSLPVFFFCIIFSRKADGTDVC